MITLAGYEKIQELYSNEKIVVLRAESLALKKTVIIKMLVDEYPDQRSIARLKHEYNLLNTLKVPGIIQAYAIEKHEHRYALVLEDIPGGITLRDFINRQTGNIDRINLFLHLSLQLAEILHELHIAHIIHKDINPGNILIAKDETNYKLILIDFSIATQLSQEMPEVKSPEVLEGTLAYMSPEQSSRMNRAIDHRTDLYSLGITLYEILTGQLPFSANDPMEWVHCHIAKQPKPPHLINNSIPEMLSKIVIKLLAKAAEERYNTAYGLRADLEKCLISWQRKHEMELFHLGEKDRSNLFHIPQKLYGREIELQHLLGVFERITKGGRSLLLVSGYPGIGKSSLVNEIHKPIIRQRGYFVSGKFEQFQQKVPYSALIQAFRKLIQQILTESQKRIEFWRNQLLRALTQNGQVIIEVIPEVEWLIGKQPAVPVLPPSEARNRFELIFFDFVHTFAHVEHPLVVFLDDLQWADAASLSLMRQLLRDESLEYFMLIGSYRDNEVSEGHPFLDVIEYLQKENVIIEKLQLNPLDASSLKQLIIDTLNTNLDVTPLAGLVLEKTSGNPFFVNTFLSELYQNKHLYFNIQQEEWIWDMATLKALTVTDNVVDLIVNKINKLPEDTQDVIKVAATIGNQFDLATLSMVYNQPAHELGKILWPAMQENLIIPLDENYKLVIADVDFADSKKPIIYKFSHDRVQQAAFSLNSEEQREKIALKIGRILLNKTFSQELDDKIFEIVNHFNNALNLVTDEKEKYQIAELNLKAGNKAKLSVAYAQAANYFEKAIQLLGEQAWQERYRFTLEAHIGYAECIHLQGQFENANREFANIIEKAQNNLDKARVTMLQVLSYTIQVKYDEAVTAGLKGLNFLGIKLDAKPSIFQVIFELIKVRIKLRSKPVENYLQSFELIDPEKRLIVDLFERVAVAGYLIEPNLIALLGLKGISYCLQNGYSVGSAAQFILYGMILVSGFRDYEGAYHFGKLCIQIVEKYDDLRMRTIVYFAVNTMLFPWRKPYAECATYLNKVFHLGRQAGELLYTNYAAALYPQLLLMQGTELKEIEKKLKKMFVIADFTKNVDTLASLKTLSKIIPVLLGEKNIEWFHERIDEYFNNKIPYSHPVAYGVSGILCLKTAYLLEDWDTAKKLVDKTQKYAYANYLQPLFITSDYFFYGSLIILTLYGQLKISEKFFYNRLLKDSIKRFKLCSKSCPENFYAKYCLIQAGVEHIKGNLAKAMSLYEQAINSARENGLIHIEAIIYEFISRLYWQSNQLKQAKLYAQEAFYAYQRWGCEAKLRALQNRFEGLQVQYGSSGYFNSQSTTKLKNTNVTASSTQNFHNLDFASVMKSSVAISSKVMLDDLLRGLIQIMIENAGASRGFLLLEKDQQLFVATYAEITESIPIILQNESAEKFGDFCQAIVQYVQNTNEPIVLNNAAVEGDFTEDTYISEKKPLSILCMPILHQSHLLGILYLENNLTPGAFTSDRLEILKLLSAQAAISLENAQLYAAYDQFVPHEFLEILGKHSIVDIKLGDHVQKNMTVLFSDIRGFTTISEKLGPSATFQFINDFLGHMEPVIQEHGGFIDKFIGDSIMALFTGSPQDAVLAGIAMQERLNSFNEELIKRNCEPIRIGVGINTGLLMLGTLGGKHRIETSVISDVVNVAARLEQLTKDYESQILLSDNTYQQLSDPTMFQSRFIGKSHVRGKLEGINVWEIYSAEPQDSRYAKMAVSTHYEQAIKLYSEGVYKDALRIFQRCYEKLPNDKVIKMYIDKCQTMLKE